MAIKAQVEENICELQLVAAALDEKQLMEAANACMVSKRIFFSGMGRSGNMVKALAIRFMHLGYDAYVAGDASTPSIEKGDLLIAVSSSAKTQVTLAHVETAKKNGAKVLLVTAMMENSNSSDYILCIPAKTKVPSAQHAGSLFEQSVLIAGDAIAAYIKVEKRISSAYMDKRHANLQ